MIGPGDDDPFDLQRFVDAQAACYGRVVAELTRGRKESHWSWFIFPQLAGLGSSAMAARYAISSLAEASAYLDHPILGARLRECVSAMNRHEGTGAEDILGHVDALKFRSCLTLFLEISEPDPAFRKALEQFFGGEPDAMTLSLLGARRKESRP